MHSSFFIQKNGQRSLTGFWTEQLINTHRHCEEKNRLVNVAMKARTVQSRRCSSVRKNNEQLGSKRSCPALRSRSVNGALGRKTGKKILRNMA